LIRPNLRWGPGVATIIVLACLPRLAHAYIDPGTGAFVWQIVLSVAASGLLAVRGVRTRIVGAIRRAFGRGGDKER